jgi:MFS family permease
MARNGIKAFESLRVRNYRLFFWGQVISWTGTWVQWMAQAWLVLQLTGSGVGLGLVTALQWSPVLVFGAWAGAVADRLDKRKLLIFTNLTTGVLSLILGLVTVAGAVTLWFVVVIALAQGLVMAIDNPARQTFTLEMVGRDRLANAVSLNTATFTTARVLGPAAAGFLIAGVGIGPCFLINAASCLPVTIALMVMNKDELKTPPVSERSKGQVREGMRYVLATPILRSLLIVMAVVGTLQYNFHVMLPLLAKQTFDGGAQTLGLMGAALGVGMFGGSMLSATMDRPAQQILVTAGLSLGTFTLLVAAAPSLLIAILLMIPLGASSMAFLATMNTTLQLNSSDAMRGRVMALYFVLFLGSTPIGAPIIGWVAEVFDPRAAFALAGTATLFACGFGLTRLPPAQDARETDADVVIAEAAT